MVTENNEYRRAVTFPAAVAGLVIAWGRYWGERGRQLDRVDLWEWKISWECCSESKGRTVV